MDAQQFSYWLQGFAELNSEPPTAEQWSAIRDHLATVFVKVTSPLTLETIEPRLTKPANRNPRSILLC